MLGEDAGSRLVTERAATATQMFSAYSPQGGGGSPHVACDMCIFQDQGFHMYCLEIPLEKVPKGDWYCDDCATQGKTSESEYNSASDEDILAPVKSSNKGGQRRQSSVSSPAPFKLLPAEIKIRGKNGTNEALAAFAKKWDGRGISAAEQKRQDKRLRTRQNILTGALPLPPSSFDLPLNDNRFIMPLLQSFEVIHRFSRVLFVKPFCFEDFARAITLKEHCALVDTIFSSLLRALSVNFPVGNTTSDTLEWALLDNSTWPELLRRFIGKFTCCRITTKDSTAGSNSRLHLYRTCKHHLEEDVCKLLHSRNPNR